MTDTSTNSGGLGLTGVLFIVFLVLKLCGTIDWSWWWVTAPLWGPLVLVLAFFAVWFFVWAGAAIFAFVAFRLASK